MCCTAGQKWKRKIKKKKEKRKIEIKKGGRERVRTSVHGKTAWNDDALVFLPVIWGISFVSFRVKENGGRKRREREGDSGFVLFVHFVLEE